jgi:hypothetical protein
VVLGGGGGGIDWCVGTLSHGLATGCFTASKPKYYRSVIFVVIFPL